MSRYVRVENRTWADEKFRALSRPQPNAQSLFLYLLTGPHAEGPGCFEAGEYGLAEKLRWPIEGFRAAMAELVDAQMVRVDWDAQVVWVVNTIKHDPPANGNVLKHWFDILETVPECALKTEYMATLEPFVARFNPPSDNAFANPSSNGLPNRSTNPLATPKPIPKPEPEPKPERREILAPDKPTRAEGKPRPRNVLFDALTEACGFAVDATLTDAEGAKIGRAASQIKAAGGTPNDVALRALRYQDKYPNASLTPLALAGHWGELATEPLPRASPNGNGQYMTAAEKQDERLRRFMIGENDGQPTAISASVTGRGVSPGN